LNHICQMVWSLSFASLLDDSLGAHLKGLMLQVGSGFDATVRAKCAQDNGQGARSHAPHHAVEDGMDENQPNTQLRLRGISVVLKPPNWEVDAKGQLSNTGRYLSQFM